MKSFIVTPHPKYPAFIKSTFVIESGKSTWIGLISRTLNSPSSWNANETDTINSSPSASCSTFPMDTPSKDKSWSFFNKQFIVLHDDDDESSCNRLGDTPDEYKESDFISRSTLHDSMLSWLDDVCQRIGVIDEQQLHSLNLVWSQSTRNSAGDRYNSKLRHKITSKMMYVPVSCWNMQSNIVDSSWFDRVRVDSNLCIISPPEDIDTVLPLIILNFKS